MRVAGLIAGAIACLAASSVAATSIVISRHWQSLECGIVLRLGDDGSATFTWDSAPMEARWDLRGKHLILRISDQLHEFEGTFVSFEDDIVGTHTWTDVAGMTGQKSCVLTRQDH